MLNLRQQGRPLTTFNIPASVVGKLSKAGFDHSKDLEGVRPIELSKEAKITLKEAGDTLDLIERSVEEGNEALSKKRTDGQELGRRSWGFR